jgi:phosphate/sulfate permease
MENFYIFIVVILFLLAISDLIVGVSNDAVNFLNSAIGSKAAPFKIIMLVAALGILVGATFSSGMMEVARKGIMHPEKFYFSEIMLIFLAVMMTDIILLDAYNTFGLPTSTTVSIVFELLGASVAIALVKMKMEGQSFAEMGEYINSTKALAIISGILLSVVIAFLVGALVQYLTRILFSFDYSKTYKRYGALFGGLAISVITYFMLIKGAKGSSFLTDSSVEWINTHTMTILGLSFVGWTVILQVLMLFTRVNIFKIIVLVGTFSLAMAFAGNDLVNFIGVPLAGFESLKTFLADPSTQADTLLMASLQGKVQTPTLYLLLAGLVMVITLWTSKKSRSVTKTTIDLSRQGEGYERFNSTGFSRLIVRQTRTFNRVVGYIVPNRVTNFIEERFDNKKAGKSAGPAGSSFDLVRASVNLVVAAILIAFGTSLKLPLSTTYVTFMVAMGTSLSDRAWGRDSAVYRITGVLTVISGWFLTAFLAFTVSFLIALLISWGGLIAILILIGLSILLLVRTHLLHRKKSAEQLKEETGEDSHKNDKKATIDQTCINNISEFLMESNAIYEGIIEGLINEDRRTLKKLKPRIDELNKNSKHLKDNIHKTIVLLREDSFEAGPHYVQVLDYMREMAHCLTFIDQPVFKHVSNNHKGLVEAQEAELASLAKQFVGFNESIRQAVVENDFDRMAGITAEQQKLLTFVYDLRKKQLKRIKSEIVGTRNSNLYINILQESKNLILFALNLLKSQRDFMQHFKK